MSHYFKFLLVMFFATSTLNIYASRLEDPQDVTLRDKIKALNITADMFESLNTQEEKQKFRVLEENLRRISNSAVQDFFKIRNNSNRNEFFSSEAVRKDLFLALSHEVFGTPEARSNVLSYISANTSRNVPQKLSDYIASMYTQIIGDWGAEFFTQGRAIELDSSFLEAIEKFEFWNIFVDAYTQQFFITN